jgi:hypothetical protein
MPMTDMAVGVGGGGNFVKQDIGLLIENNFQEDCKNSNYGTQTS